MFKLIKSTFKVGLKAGAAVFGAATGLTLFVAMCEAVDKAKKSEETE